MQQAMEVPVVEKSWLYQRLGIVKELQLKFEAAIDYYEKAILLTLNEEKIKQIEQIIIYNS